MSLCTLVFVALAGFGGAVYLDKKQASLEASTSTSVPQYFQTTPEIYAGNYVCQRTKLRCFG